MTTHAQHTPGPWKFDKHTPYFCTIRDASNRFIGELTDLEAGTVGQMEANARLIAAAPRMLERIRRDVEQCGCNSLPVRPLKMPDGSIQVGCGYCREKRAILRDVEGN